MATSRMFSTGEFAWQLVVNLSELSTVDAHCTPVLSQGEVTIQLPHECMIIPLGVIHRKTKISRRKYNNYLQSVIGNVSPKFLVVLLNESFLQYHDNTDNQFGDSLTKLTLNNIIDGVSIISKESVLLPQTLHTILRETKFYSDPTNGDYARALAWLISLLKDRVKQEEWVSQLACMKPSDWLHREKACVADQLWYLNYPIIATPLCLLSTPCFILCGLFDSLIDIKGIKYVKQIILFQTLYNNNGNNQNNEKLSLFN